MSLENKYQTLTHFCLSLFLPPPPPPRPLRFSCTQRNRCESADEPYRFAASLNQCVKATVYPDSIAVSEPSVPVSVHRHPRSHTRPARAPETRRHPSTSPRLPAGAARVHGADRAFCPVVIADDT